MQDYLIHQILLASYTCATTGDDFEYIGYALKEYRLIYKSFLSKLIAIILSVLALLCTNVGVFLFKADFMFKVEIARIDERERELCAFVSLIFHLKLKENRFFHVA